MSATEQRTENTKHLENEFNILLSNKTLNGIRHAARNEPWRSAVGHRATEVEAGHQAGPWSSPTDVLEGLLKGITA